MKIAIIGAGNVGGALGGSMARVGHEVTMTSSTPDEARSVAEGIGARFAPTSAEAVEDAELVILAVPYASLDAVLADVGDRLGGKVVVDVTNPLTPDYSALATEGTSAAEQIQARVPGAKVVKAFNTVLASRQAQPDVDGAPVDGLAAGDDNSARAAVLDLIRSIGMRPVDAGPLAMARALEAMAFLNIAMQMRGKGSWQTAWKLVGPLPQPA